jgi:hypothetical protein
MELAASSNINNSSSSMDWASTDSPSQKSRTMKEDGRSGNVVPNYSEMNAKTPNLSDSSLINDILPKDIILYIFSWLEPEQLAKASLVCTLWNYYSKTEYLWREYCYIKGYNSTTPHTDCHDSWQRTYINHGKMSYLFRLI